MSQFKCISLFHFILATGDTVKPFQQVKRFPIAHHLHIGVVFLHKSERPTVVGFHMVGYDIIDGTVADYLANIFYKL